jgi:hypothetical protein
MARAEGTNEINQMFDSSAVFAMIYGCKKGTGIPSRSIRSIESENRGVVRPLRYGPDPKKT